tara:strand:- start:867 stop:1409 length:543 start_codon:yes stop_codon:yes gene_type:complete
MATVNLLPNGDVLNNWDLSTGSLAWQLVGGAAHGGTIASDSTYLHSSTTSDSFIVEMSDFTEAYSSIDGVQGVVQSGNNGRGASFTIEMAMVSASGTFWPLESSGSQAGSRDYRTQTFTNRTTSDGSNAWTTGDLKNLRMRVDLTAHSSVVDTRCTFCYFIVTYTPPLVTDNSIFFGTNF